MISVRLRKIKNLEARREKCTDLRIPYELKSFDYRTDDTEESFLNIDEIFGRTAPLVMEIGCGKGQFVCEYARRNPEKNIIAVECVPGVLVEACERAKSLSVPNVKFLEMKAEYLPLFIKEKSVSEIYLNFSTPFPKTKHESHRLTSKGFLEIYKKILCDDGFIAQKTDNEDFFNYSLESYEANGFAVFEVSRDLHNSGFKDNIVTEYEQKFADMGMPIFRVVAKPESNM